VLWVLFIGGTVALETPEEVWFQAEITNLLLLIQLPDWKRIEAWLEETVES
jgi:hypothetical protein